MHVSYYLDDVVVWAPAKVNLFLEVLGKRAEAYHEIATLMVAVGLYDTLVFRDDASGQVRLSCSSKTLSVGEDNLVFRAANLLKKRTGVKNGANIRLTKRIPMAAGLGGGSSDAAATLIGLNRLWQVGLTRRELANLGAELGSDIPFFFHTPAAWCTGRGETVRPVKVGAPLFFVLLCPSFGTSTADVYKLVAIPAAPISGDAIVEALAQGDVEIIGRLLHNRLQTAAELLDDRIREYKQLLAAQKPAGQALSGSGSTLFGLCRSTQEAKELRDKVKAGPHGQEFQLILTRSL